MTLAIWYWLFMVLWLVLGFFFGYTPGQPYTYRSWGGNVLLFVLLLIVGIQVFGTPFK